MAIPTQATSRLVIWVLVGMALAPSLACSRPAPVQPASTVAGLMTQLHDGDPAVRAAAASALGNHGAAAKDAVKIEP
jgi:hypothetical protein